MKKILITLLLLLSSTAANAASTVIDSMIKSMLADIGAKTEYQLPLTNPKIVWTTQKKLRDLICPGKQCAINAVTINQTVYLDRRQIILITVYGRSVLYHELVHIVQVHNLGDPKTCAQRTIYEHEAYNLQADYSKQQGFEFTDLRNLAEKLTCDYQYRP